MSGYRSLHREKVQGGAVWCVAVTPLMNQPPNSQLSPISYRVWTASADGLVRSYRVQESKDNVNKSETDSLNASAMSIQCTHLLLGKSQQHVNAKQDQQRVSDETVLSMGCTRLSITQYRDSFVCLSIDLLGTVRIWNIPEGFENDQKELNVPRVIISLTEFVVEFATGTTAVLCPHDNQVNDDSLVAAIGCLDGSIALVATGLPQLIQPKQNDKNNDKGYSQPYAPGTLLKRVGGSTNSGYCNESVVPLSLCWSPTDIPVEGGTGRFLAVGRQDGSIDIMLLRFNNKRKNEFDSYLLLQQRLSRHHHSPVRALSFTQDGNLMLAGCDQGFLTIWDTSRIRAQTVSELSLPLAVMAHHVLDAHASWILQSTSLDTNRFVTAGADRTLRVWDVTRGMHQPVHTFQTDQIAWTVHASTHKSYSNLPSSSGLMKLPPRLVTGSDTGYVHVFSLEK